MRSLTTVRKHTPPSRWCTVMALALAILVLLTGCGTGTQPSSPAEPGAPGGSQPGGGASSGEPKRGGVLRIVDEPPGTPFGVPWEMVSTGVIPAIPVLEPLVWMDWTGDKVTPKLAERWEVAQDRKSITLYLRKGVKFHDGTGFDAEAVRFNLQHQIEAKRIPGLTSVDVLDSHTVKLNLEEWDNSIFLYLSDVVTWMISPTAFQQNGSEWARYHPVGTGPFEFVSYERDVRAQYKRFEGYWDQGKPYLDGVELRFIEDDQTAKLAFLGGEVDMLSMTVNEIAAELMGAGYPAIKYQSGFQLLHLWPDSVNAGSPFAKREVRLAVSHAIDRKAVAEARGFGTGIPAYQIAFPDTAPFIPDDPGHPYDPERAKELLAQAGYPNGFETKMIMSPYLDRDTAVAIQQYLSAVGIRAELETPEFSRYREYQINGWSGLLLGPMGYFPNYPRLMQAYFMGGTLAYNSVRRPPGFDRLWNEARSTLNQEPEKVQALNRLITDDMMVVPVYVYTRVYVMQPYVRDTNHMSAAAWPWWTPAEAWLDR